jgi:hypothetical protein
VTTTEKPLHVRQAEGLRALAAMIEEHPELTAGPLSTLKLRRHIFDGADALAEFARVAARYCDGPVQKEYHDEYAHVNASFGAISVDLQTDRDQVCERVVTGKTTVTKQVPDPDALAAVPLVEVTEEVETVEWKCRPLLAAAESGKDGGK